MTFYFNGFMYYSVRENYTSPAAVTYFKKANNPAAVPEIIGFSEFLEAWRGFCAQEEGTSDNE